MCARMGYAHVGAHVRSTQTNNAHMGSTFTFVLMGAHMKAAQMHSARMCLCSFKSAYTVHTHTHAQRIGPRLQRLWLAEADMSG